MAPKTPLLRTTRRFLAIFASPPGPQNQPKIDPWPQKGRQEAIFYRFLSRTAFVSLLGLIFHRFFVIFDQKIDAFFQRRAQFFQHGDGLNLCTGAVF